MKVVINVCFGGFSLSPLAVKRLSELKGKQCFFFSSKGYPNDYEPIDMPTSDTFSWSAFTVSNPTEYLKSGKDWHSMTQKERTQHNKKHDEITLSARPENRSDTDLIKTIEELGDTANGSCAELKIVQIPDGIEYEIDEYDGNESIHEAHRSWN